MEEEFLQHAYGRKAEMAIAQRHEEVIFELAEDLVPVVKIF